jgi:hypothetical protein
VKAIGHPETKAMSGTAYIPRGGEQVYSPPFVAEGVQFFGFVVAADKAKLQDICDRYLNGPSSRM